MSGAYALVVLLPRRIDSSIYGTKKTHRRKGCGWLASRRDSKYKKKHIVAKDVVGLLLGDSKNDSLTKMKTY